MDTELDKPPLTYALTHATAKLRYSWTVLQSDLLARSRSNTSKWEGNQCLYYPSGTSGHALIYI